MIALLRNMSCVLLTLGLTGICTLEADQVTFTLDPGQSTLTMVGTFFSPDAGGVPQPIETQPIPWAPNVFDKSLGTTYSGTITTNISDGFDSIEIVKALMNAASQPSPAYPLYR
jgi:hypothetical protein